MLQRLLGGGVVVLAVVGWVGWAGELGREGEPKGPTVLLDVDKAITYDVQMYHQLAAVIEEATSIDERKKELREKIRRDGSLYRKDSEEWLEFKLEVAAGEAKLGHELEQVKRREFEVYDRAYQRIQVKVEEFVKNYGVGLVLRKENPDRKYQRETEFEQLVMSKLGNLVVYDQGRDITGAIIDSTVTDPLPDDAKISKDPSRTLSRPIDEIRALGLRMPYPPLRCRTPSKARGSDSAINNQ